LKVFIIYYEGSCLRFIDLIATPLQILLYCSGVGELSSVLPYAEILEDFPYLTSTDILACLSYAADREPAMLTRILAA
jgi:Protein of unknown function (DUF433)